MSAFYYYAYAPMQIPAGMLYDRYGARRILTFAILVCAVGALAFGMTQSIIFASLGRMLMGVGSAFAFIGALVLIARWFPPSYFAVLAGLAQALSSVGAVTGEAPLAELVSHYGWRHTISTLGLIGIGLACLIYLFVRNSPDGDTPGDRETAPEKKEAIYANLKRVCSQRQTWWLGGYSFCIWAPITCFAALWGVPFLMALYHTSVAHASFACSMIWVGIGVGSPLFGWISDRLALRCAPLAFSAVIGVLSAAAMLYVPMSMSAMCVCLFFFWSSR